VSVSTQETSESGFLDIIKLLLAAGVTVAMTSTQGQRLWAFIQGARVEIRKVVWPTKQETTQTAIAVFVFTLIMALFFWGLDSFLLWLTRTLVGSTG
jgi:preprotein translocase subunit SecE